jgi:geranylgeranyl diphosphate synthase type I
VSPVGKWGNDGVLRILNVTTQGKLLRSALLFLSAESLSHQYNHEIAVKTAAAIELFQTGLLVHDDIMDRDEKRRGFDSMHIQYKKILEQCGAKNPDRIGESLALCVGDMTFFLAFHIFSTIEPPHLSVKLINLFSSEIAKVGVAQMQDVYGGNSEKQVSKDEILSVYTYKTGRYTCGLPLVAGAIIAGANPQTIRHLWRLGTALGILYQIKDDWLNLFGDPQKTGKPVGSDIREGKQTLYRLFLLEKSDSKTKEKLRSLYGNPKITEKDTAFVQKEIKTLGVEEEINIIVEKQKEIVNEVLSHLPIPKDKRVLFDEFIRYITEREK